MTDPVPDIPVTPVREVPGGRASLVWLVPLAALAVAGVVAWQTVADQGPLIEIAFADAAGVAARETELRYRDVTVGLVERVRFSEGLETVLVSVRLDREVAPYVDADARFWVVEPQVTPQGITGIETVLTGVFIEGLWDNQAGGTLDRFEGLAQAPLLAAGQDGLSLLLRSSDGALTSEMPLLYKGVTVGQVGPPRVSADGLTVEADAVVYAPYDALITQSTRFWDASGFRLNVGANGADVDFDSLSSLLVGGLTFENFVTDAAPAEDGDVFVAYYDESLARDSIFGVAEGGPPLSLTATFSGNVAALAEGSAVELDGLRIGEVTDVASRIDPDDGRVRVRAVLALQPARLALDAEGEAEGGPDAVLDFLTRQVAGGLRARLVTGNLLGGLKVQLVQVADAPPAAIDLDAVPFPAIPTTANDIADIAATAQGAIERIDALPIEELLGSAIGFLDNAAVLVGSAETQGIPGEVRGLLGDLRGVAGAPEVQALPGQVATLLDDANGTVAELRAVLADIQEAQAVSRLLNAVDRAGLAAEQVGQATAGVPALVDRLTAIAAQAEAAEIDALVAEVRGLAADGRALLAAPGLRELPAQVGGLAAEAQAAVAEVRVAVAGLDAPALSARLAATLAAAEEAARGLDASLAGVPALTERLTAVAAQAEAAGLPALAAEVRGLASDGRALLTAPGLQDLPAQVGALSTEAQGALAEARGLLSEVDAAGLTARLDATLTSADAALAAVGASVAGVPALVARLDALAATANELPIEALVAELTALARSADALVSAPGTQALPADLSATLAEAAALLREAREGGVVANANATLQAARAAADSLPGLVAQAEALLDQATVTVGTFGESSGVVAQAEAAIREVAGAAEAVADLARAIERDPNSLIFGD